MNQILLEALTLLPACISLGIIILAWKNRNIRGVRTLFALMFMITLWAFGYAMELNAATISKKLLWVKVEYLAILMIPTLNLLFVSFYTRSESWFLRTGSHIPLLFALIEPIVAYVLLLTNPSHHLFYTQLTLDHTYGFPNLIITHGIAYRINQYYSYLLFLIVLILIIKQYFRCSGDYRSQSVLLLLSQLIPWVGNILYQYAPPLLHGIDPTPPLLFISVLLTAGALRIVRNPLMLISYIEIIHAMDEVIIVLDLEGYIVNINPATEIRLGLSSKQVIGQHVQSVEQLSEKVRSLLNPLRPRKENISLSQHSVQRIYDLSLIPLHAGYGKRPRIMGWLLTLHDVTHISKLEGLLLKRNLELEKIDALVASINKNLALDKVLQTCIEAVRDLYPEPYKMTIQLIEKNSYAYTVAGTAPLDGSQQRLHFAPGEGILGDAIRKQQLCNVPSVLQDPRYVPGPIAPTYRSLLVIPMTTHGKTIGAFSITSPHAGAFDKHDELLLQRLADHAAMAVANARLYEQAKREILERELAEKTARSSAEQYHLLFNSTTNAIFVTQRMSKLPTTSTSCRQFTDVNEKACALLGYTREELLERNIFALVTEDSRKLLPGHCKRMQEHKESHTRLLFRKKNGEEIPFEFHSRLLDVLGTSTVISIAWDLSEYERIEALQRQRIAELEEHNAELDAFAHTVSHDLKNPLAAIIGFSQMIERRGDKLPPYKLRHYARFISKGANKMQLIIDSLMTMAQAKTLQKVPIAPLENIREIIYESWQRLSVIDQYEEAEVMIAESYPVAMGYAPWVEEIWSNYLSNALKYGGSPPRIECGGEQQEDGMIRFWVRDNGPGLSPEARKQLFMPFVRLRSQGIQGHGLGLSIVLRIAQRLGGTAGVESDGQHGSTFYFTLPAVEREQP